MKSIQPLRAGSPLSSKSIGKRSISTQPGLMRNSSIRREADCSFGEAHGIALNEDLDLALLRYLHKTAGVRVYLEETSYATSRLLNRYLDTGDERVLDSIMQRFYPTLGWTKENRAFYVNFRKWNLTLPEKERVHIVGLDVEHRRSVALHYLAEAAKANGGRTTPGRIAEMVGKLRRIEQETSGKKVEQFIGALTSDVAAHRDEYGALLGDGIFDFELVAGNLRRTMEAQTRPEQRFMELRERVMYDTFLKVYPRLGGAKCYGRWGAAHIMQRRVDFGESLAVKLNRRDSPVSGKVVSIYGLYENSEALTQDYGKVPANSNDALAKPFSAASAGPLTLFKLTAGDSPFRHELFSFMTGKGVLTDYLQYVILIKNAPASQVLGGQPGRLGVGVQLLTSDVGAGPGAKHAHGVLVGSVMPGGPGERAGVRVGDVITALNGNSVDDPQTFVNCIFATGPGETVTLSIVRDGQNMQVSTKLEDFTGPPGETETRGEGPKLGVVVQGLTPSLAAKLRIAKSTQGLLVREVYPATPAADAGVQPGDVLVEIDGQPIRDVADVAAAMQHPASEPSLLLVHRAGQNLRLTVHR